jgi:thymidylate synthase (FAD)
MKIANMDVEYLDHMGSDLTVVNAARVSFDKEHDEFDYKTDRGLIKYLATHNHWSPFAHCSASFRVKAPIFVARQLMKHTVGFSWNEVSRRYVDSDPEFFIPQVWRKRADNVKQGSSSEEAPRYETTDADGTVWYTDPETEHRDLVDHAIKVYEEMRSAGVAPEQARMVLPQSMMTEWIWTGTLYAWARMCTLRMDSHTQTETRVIAQVVSDHMAEIYPTSWEFLMNTEPKEKVCTLLSSTLTSLPTSQP